MTAPRLAAKTVGVIGSGSADYVELARPLGALLASMAVNLLTGGGQGVMQSVAKAYLEAEPHAGISIGVLPSRNDDAGVPAPGYPNPYVQLAIRTHLPDRGREGRSAGSRNHLNVLNSDAIVALPGSFGTESEVDLALMYGKPMIVYFDDAAAIARFPHEIQRTRDINEVAAFLRHMLSEH